MNVPVFTRDSRLILFAPHPDDESLGCGVALQRAVRVGATIRVVYATDGENNPWPQRWLFRKLRLNPNDRRRWGKWRRFEALAALRTLGISSAQVAFLGLPDQKLSILLMSDCQSIPDHLAAIVNDFCPTDLLIPSLSDTHPDHSALAVILRLALNIGPVNHAETRVWHYIVHGRSPAFFDRAARLSQSQAEEGAKRSAIARHKTQLALSRRRFFGYAVRPEYFLRSTAPSRLIPDGSVVWLSRGEESLRLRLRMPIKILFSSDVSLLILGRDINGRLRSVRVAVPVRSQEIELVDLIESHSLGVASYCGDRFGGELEIPLAMFSVAEPVFLKIESRGWFFDEAGWIELPHSPQLSPNHSEADRELNLGVARFGLTEP
jgi:LmbE family N-acetylglucosaminyl deacetylase